jgi:hypothetical protein
MQDLIFHSYYPPNNIHEKIFIQYFKLRNKSLFTFRKIIIYAVALKKMEDKIIEKLFMERFKTE